MNKKTSGVEQVNLKEFFKVIFKRKIAFLITFFLIFSIGLAYTFISAPEYGVSSEMRISDDYTYYKSELYKYFPEEADNLWIIPEDTVNNEIYYIFTKSEPIVDELKSDSILNTVLENIEGDLNKVDLYRSIDVHLSRNNGILTITAYAQTPVLAYSINKTVIDTFIEYKKIYLEESFNDLFVVLDIRIEEIEDNEDIQSDEEYTFLRDIKQTLLVDKELFINRLEILEKPELYKVWDQSNYLRNVLLSILFSLVFGIITAFIVNYFKSTKE